MTREYWQARKHLVDAFCDGKTILLRVGNDFLPCEELNFTRPVEDYKIQLPPKLRTWRDGEIPLGALWKMGAFSAVYTPDFVSNMGVNIAGVTHGPNSLFTQWQHSIDNGRTWLKCGVMEEGE